MLARGLAKRCTPPNVYATVPRGPSRSSRGYSAIVSAMKLYYFDIAGRAEVARLTLRYGNVDFEDIRFSSEEWRSQYKALSPTGQAPFLQVDDGNIICQSGAITLYAAEVGKLGAGDVLSRARLVELLNTIEDSFKPMVPTFALKDLDEKVAARKKLLEAPQGKLYVSMSNLDSMVREAVASSPGDFYFGDKPTTPDFAIFVMVNSLLSGAFDGISKDDVAQFTSLMALRGKVAALPKVKELYADAGEKYAVYRE